MPLNKEIKPDQIKIITYYYSTLTALKLCQKIKFHKYIQEVYLVCLFNGMSTFMGYLMPEPSLQKNSSGTI